MDHFRIKRIISAIIFRLLYSKRFKHYGKKTSLISPLNVIGYNNIKLYNNVYIGYKCLLAAMPLTGECECLLEIGSGTNIGNFNHIFATKMIKIGNNVLTADKVYISDNSHNYENVSIPIKQQSIKQLNTVEIGDGTWIGENVCILGAKIGKNCVIGANSIVTKDIPDYSVAVGSPAKIIKRFCQKDSLWRLTDTSGNFINNKQ
jgi:acetyltransferase-like isoleucine patch superfamily enzyme